MEQDCERIFCWGQAHIAEFDLLSDIITIALAPPNIMWLYAFPMWVSISSTVTPQISVTGVPIDFLQHWRCPVGAYAHTHKSLDSTDNPRTSGASCLGPMGHLQGICTCMSLSKGPYIYRTKFAKLPTPNEIIKRVHTPAKSDKACKELVFKNRNILPWDDVEDSWVVPHANIGVYHKDIESGEDSHQSKKF